MIPVHKQQGKNWLLKKKTPCLNNLACWPRTGFLLLLLCSCPIMWGSWQLLYCERWKKQVEETDTGMYILSKFWLNLAEQIMCKVVLILGCHCAYSLSLFRKEDSYLMFFLNRYSRVMFWGKGSLVSCSEQGGQDPTLSSWTCSDVWTWLTGTCLTSIWQKSHYHWWIWPQARSNVILISTC